MRIIRRVLKILAVLGLLVNLCSAQITTGSLLEEMTDREAITKFPTTAYTCAQFSSYDRHSVKPYDDGWFANWDRSYWIRTENNSGRREFVMMDIEGPGAVVRFWVTVAKYGGNGILRIYLDNDKEPVIEGEIFSILSGNGLVAEPLASSVSKSTNYHQRGHNLYFPIAYSEHCKITYESDAQTNAPGAQSGEALYYNINYRTYEESAKITSFSMADLETYKTLIETTASKLLESNPTILDGEIEDINGTIAPDQEIQKDFSGEKAIHQIKLKLQASNHEQALRSTVLEISFDGEQTVWCPIGDFFGTGYKLSPFSSYYCLVENDSTLTANWIMPFKESCTLIIHNYGEQEVAIKTSSIATKPYNWTDESMYFGAGWYESYKMYTGDGPRPMDGNNPNFFDMNYVTLQGKGLYVGDGVTLFNTSSGNGWKNWWGEGDEKVYIDYESFPSHIGTGTEDYYGYAWSRPEKFSHPYIAQPDGSGNMNAGYTVNLRYRGLDAIPFKQHLKFDIELWHWSSCIINHAPVTFWYMIPGGSSNRGAVPDQVKNIVVTDVSDFYSKSPNEAGRVEGEYMKASCSAGNIRGQAVDHFNWSNNQQVWWTGGYSGASAFLVFDIEEEGNCNLKISLTKAIDYGIFDIKLDGKIVLSNFDAYHPDGVTNEVVSLGTHFLKQGAHKLEFIIKGANQSAIKGYMVGIDYIDVLPTTITGINTTVSNTGSGIKVYPNPFSKNIDIELRNPTKGFYSIYTINGSKVFSGELTGNAIQSIDLGFLNRGIYILKFNNGRFVRLIKM